MSDYIKREDAIEAIENTDWYHFNSQAEMVHGANSDLHQAWYSANDIYSAVENVPSADVAPVRHGHWIKISPAGIYECSECGKNVMTSDIEAYEYCHGCGARMDGEDNETD